MLKRLIRSLMPAPAASGSEDLAVELRRLTARLGDLGNMQFLNYQAACWSVREQLLAHPGHQDPRRLERHGHKVYSQNDEDGILEEIFRRIGTTGRVFIEIGVQDGLENNTLHLLNGGWSGCWLEASPGYVEKINERFREPIGAGRLKVAQAIVDRDNVDALIRGFGTGSQPDLLSIDIDGNDYHVWEAIACVQPRVVVIEYNAKFRPPARWVMAYDPRHRWDGSDQMGTSLESLNDLAARRGYRLVGCNLTGANAFFVRSELAADKFQEPGTAANFYHPARYFLTESYVSGHPAGFGKGKTPA